MSPHGTTQTIMSNMLLTDVTMLGTMEYGILLFARRAATKAVTSTCSCCKHCLRIIMNWQQIKMNVTFAGLTIIIHNHHFTGFPISTVQIAQMTKLNMVLAEFFEKGMLTFYGKI